MKKDYFMVNHWNNKDGIIAFSEDVNTIWEMIKNDGTTNFKSLQKRIVQLISNLSHEKIMELLTVALFTVRIAKKSHTKIGINTENLNKNFGSIICPLPL